MACLLVTVAAAAFAAGEAKARTDSARRVEGVVAETVAAVVGARRLEAADSADRVRIGLATDSDGTPGLRLFDKEGKLLWQAPETGHKQATPIRVDT